MGQQVTAKLKHADGTEVAAQEAYDAFMNTRVLIVDGIDTYEAISMKWDGNNSAQNDPTNVGYVEICFIYDSLASTTVKHAAAGDSSLVPAKQG